MYFLGRRFGGFDVGTLAPIYKEGLPATNLGAPVKMLLGHLQRADASGRRKRSVLVHLRRDLKRKWVAVRPAWQARAAGQHILSALGFLIVSNLNVNVNRRKLK
jgi:hypothetical protein